jgi:sugar phosphate isomerase/epimerase
MTPLDCQWTLTGFADEIASDLVDQLKVVNELGLRFLEFRSAWGINVADLDPTQVDRAQRELARAEVGVSGIGSPIGKVPVGAPLAEELERLRRVCAIAQRFGTNLVRVFSFFLPGGQPPQRYRDQVVERMAALAAVAESEGIVLAHENEKKIFGDRPERCLDLITAVHSPALRATFDAANFVQCGVEPFTDAYPMLRPHLVYLQVKDARADTGEVTVAGAGDGQVRETLAALRDSGFSGFVSLEPHLARAGTFGGFSGPDGFRAAHAALVGLLDELGVTGG